MMGTSVNGADNGVNSKVNEKLGNAGTWGKEGDSSAAGTRSNQGAAGRSFDVIVVGGGVAGLAVAYYLSGEKSLRIAVVERGTLGHGATWAAAGMLAVQCEIDRPGPFLTLALAGRALYARLGPRLYDETGVDIGLRRCGALRVALSEEEAESLQREAEEQRSWTLRAQWLDADEVRRLAPALTPGVVGGLLLPDDGHVDNRNLVLALAAACARRGVRLMEHTEVTGWLTRQRSGLSREGEVLGVVTGSEKLFAGAVVLAGGSWSGQLAARLGVKLPVAPVRGEMVALRTPEEPLECIVFQKDACYLVPKPGGRLLVGATESRVGFRNVPTLGGLGSLASAATALAPGLGGAEVSGYWSGLRPGTPDGLPILGPVPGWSGLYVTTGHYRNGILLGPLSGLIIARLIQGEPVPANWRPFALNGRFAAGESDEGWEGDPAGEDLNLQEEALSL